MDCAQGGLVLVASGNGQKPKLGGQPWGGCVCAAESRAATPTGPGAGLSVCAHMCMCVSMSVSRPRSTPPVRRALPGGPGLLQTTSLVPGGSPWQGTWIHLWTVNRLLQMAYLPSLAAWLPRVCWDLPNSNC